MRRIVSALALTFLALAGCRSTTVEPPVAPSTSIVTTTDGLSYAPEGFTADLVAEGLLNPVGLALLDDGRLLIAEEGTGDNDLSAGVSMLIPDGSIGRVISGLPSSRDSGDLSGVPLVGITPDGSTVYTAHFGLGHLLTVDIDQLVIDTPLGPEDLAPVMEPLNNVTLTNPFDIAFDAEGVPVVTDASENGVATQNPDGTTVFFHRFDSLPDTSNPDLLINAVPTGIARLGDEYLVTLTGGCPYPPASGQLVAIDTERNQRIVADGLYMPIDVTVDGDGTIWILEFATFEEGASCFSGQGYQPGTGRLSRLLDDGTRELLWQGLDFPGSVVATDSGFYVSEVFTGRLWKVNLGSDGLVPLSSGPITNSSGSETWELAEATGNVGVDFQHGAFPEEISDDPAAMMGAGLCWLDFDRDGWMDLYLINSHAKNDVAYWESTTGLPTNALYRNDGGTFEDVSAATNTDLAVRGNGCLAEDFDLDGWTDMYLTIDGDDVVLRNNGNGFDVIDAGIDSPEWNTAAAAGDLNGDGYPELFVGSYIDLGRKIAKPSGAFPQDFLGIPDRFYVNESTPGTIRFRDVTEASGLLHEERALGALFTDVDLDGDLDLYIANDGQSNRLYENTEGGELDFQLVDVTASADVGDTGSGMGVAGGDYDGDGSFDLFVTNWEAELNALYRNQTVDQLDFLYATQRIGLAGLGNNKTAWGATWADLDHDTDLDLLVAHGRVPVSDFDSDPELVRFYANLTADGSVGQLRDKSLDVRLDLVGGLLARGSALADFDNDGDLDVAINSISGSAHLLRNTGPVGNWLLIAGLPPGTVATAKLPDGHTLVRERHSGSSYLATEDSRVHFGLGDHERIDLTLRFPDGVVLVLGGIAANQIIAVEHP